MRLVLSTFRTKYQITEFLGEGLTSCVYKAIRKHSKWNIEQTVALKVFKSTDVVQSLKNEIAALCKIRSEHCVKLLGWDETANGTALVLEYLEGMTLYEFAGLEDIEDDLITEIILQVQQGLKDLSSQGLSHGDLNAKNVFITNTGQVKLLDFGLSVPEKTIVEYGTPQFLAPEIWRGQGSTLQADLFSLGLLWEDLKARRLFMKQAQSYWQHRALEGKESNSLLRKKPDQRVYLPGLSQPHRKMQLAEKICFYLKHKQSFQSTMKFQSKKESLSSNKLGQVGFLLMFLFYQSHTQTADLPVNKSKYSLDIRSAQWLQISVYKKQKKFGVYTIKESAYTPYLMKSLPTGNYEIHWNSQSKKGKILVHLKQNRRIIIK